MKTTKFFNPWRAGLFKPKDVPWQAPPPYVRSTPRPPSLNGGVDRSAAPAKPAPRYTGTECLGVAAMHKSNLVPVFNTEAAVDTAKMRRS